MTPPQSGSNRPQLPVGKILDIEAAAHRTVSSNGMTSEGTANVVYVGPVLDCGTMIEDMRLLCVTHARTDNIRWELVGEWSYDLEMWTSFGTALMSPAGSAIGQNNTSVHTARTDYGRYVRFKLLGWNNSGSAQESAVISVTVSIKFYT